MSFYSVADQNIRSFLSMRPFRILLDRFYCTEEIEPEGGTIRINLPGGRHMKEAGVIDLFYKATGFPRPDKNGKYSVEYPADDIPRDFRNKDIKKVKVSVRRPRDVPHSGGIGITGEDWIRETLGIGVSNGKNVDYKNELDNHSRILLYDTGIRPAFMIAAVDEDNSDVKLLSDFRKYLDDYEKIRLVTTYPLITATLFEDEGFNPYILPRERLPEQADIPKDADILIRVIDGAAEGYVPDEAEGIIDIAETGKSMMDNGCRGIRKTADEAPIMKTTVQMVAEKEVYETHPKFTERMTERMADVVEEDKKNGHYEERYKDKLDRRVFG